MTASEAHKKARVGLALSCCGLVAAILPMLLALIGRFLVGGDPVATSALNLVFGGGLTVGIIFLAFSAATLYETLEQVLPKAADDGQESKNE